MLSGIIPIVLIPFDAQGHIVEADLRRVVRFELEGGCDAIGVNGFASEAYKMSEAERLHCASIVADEVAGQVPLIIGIAPGSLVSALQQAEHYAPMQPAALMTLPPATMPYPEEALVEFYVRLGEGAPLPIMVQQSAHYPGYSATALSVESLAAIAVGSANVRYFKIEGPGSAARIAGLKPLVGEDVRLFGGVGGIAMREELQAGAAGLLPGVGFNEYFVRIWAAWQAGDAAQVDTLLQEVQPLVAAVSGRGHEFSLHARKFLLARAGIIQAAGVRFPSQAPTPQELAAIAQAADALPLRIRPA